ncbi:MAG: AAA family ATPase, partial [Frankiaceae bacterium]|nr:AAA family ATPase [Frankiaceae bacterium]
MGGSSLRIRLLGGLDVDGVDVAAFGSRKARTLLKRLALDAGRPVPIDTLVATLWPDDDGPERPADQVSVLVSRLRRVLGSETITYSDGAYSLAATWLDIDELRERADEAARRLTAGNPALARAAAAAALALVRGPLLPEDSDEPWTEATRSAVDRQIARTRQVAAEGALAGRLPWEAVEHAAAALAADPYDEAALRLLMRAQVAAGRPALALAAYAETAALVATDLGVDLSAESRAVHAEVLRGDLEAATPSAPADVPPLIGRDRELAALEAAFDRARAGSAAVVTVEGEAGIGKTRLLTSFADRVSPAADVLWGTAGAVGVLPLEPVLDALAGRLASATDDDRAALLGAEAELLGLLLRAGTAAADPTAYGEFLRAYEPGDQSAPAVLHVAVLSVVARLAARRPVVLLLDDVHLADAATLAWLGFIARRGSGLRVLVVAARRPDTRQVPGEEPILVDRLDATAAAAVVSPYLAADRVEAVVARSAGLPLFLVELAHSGGGELPDSIRDAVVERLADAGAATATLHAAAVLGNEIDVDLLATVLDVPASQLLDHLDDGARRRILDDAPTGYVFRHDLVREALEADTPSARRAWLHREAARTLSRRRPAEQLRVAHHARLGGDAPLAAAALCAAAEQSGARFDHSEALRLAEASLELVETPDAHLIRGRSLVMLRRYAEARDAAHRAHTLGADGVALEVAAFASYYARDL